MKLICLICSAVSFFLGAIGIQARVSWDQLGKAFFVLSLIV